LHKDADEQGWNEKSLGCCTAVNYYMHCNKGVCAPSSITQETIMKIVLSIATAAMIASGAGAMAAELPTFEVAGFPISPVQVQVLGAANVREQSPVAALTPDKLASPHQTTPRAKRTAAATAPAATTTGVVAR
jgi:hypothetical protein